MGSASAAAACPGPAERIEEKVPAEFRSEIAAVDLDAPLDVFAILSGPEWFDEATTCAAHLGGTDFWTSRDDAAVFTATFPAGTIERFASEPYVRTLHSAWLPGPSVPEE